jgi:hypothetical protein
MVLAKLACKPAKNKVFIIFNFIFISSETSSIIDEPREEPFDLPSSFIAP